MYKAKKELGQNFLVDKTTVREMINALSVQEHDLIIEIGAGHGALTEELVPLISLTSSDLIAVEIDHPLAEKLFGMYVDTPRVVVVEDDIMQWFPLFEATKNYKVLGSLPYYLTSPILHIMVKAKRRPDVCVFMVQKEVADKLVSSAPDASYLSSFVQTFFKVEFIKAVPREFFDPSPNVDSGIIKLVRNDFDMSLSDTIKYEGFLHKAYSHPRKMLNKAFKPEELLLGSVDPTLRAQNLNPSQWVDFFYKLQSVSAK